MTCALALRDPFFCMPDWVRKLNCAPKKSDAKKEICPILKEKLVSYILVKLLLIYSFLLLAYLNDK